MGISDLLVSTCEQQHRDSLLNYKPSIQKRKLMSELERRTIDQSETTEDEPLTFEEDDGGGSLLTF